MVILKKMFYLKPTFSQAYCVFHLDTLLGQLYFTAKQWVTACPSGDSVFCYKILKTNKMFVYWKNSNTNQNKPIKIDIIKQKPKFTGEEKNLNKHPGNSCLGHPCVCQTPLVCQMSSDNIGEKSSFTFSWCRRRRPDDEVTAKWFLDVFSGGVLRLQADQRLLNTWDICKVSLRSGCAGAPSDSPGRWKPSCSLYIRRASPLCGFSCDTSGRTSGWTASSRCHTCRASRRCGFAGEIGGLCAAWNASHRDYIERVSLLCVICCGWLACCDI